TNSGPRGKDDQVGFLQAAGHAVEIGEAGGDADDGAAALVQLVELVQIFVQRLADVLQVGTGVALADLKDQLLGLVERGGGVRLVVCHGGNLSRHVDQP